MRSRAGVQYFMLRPPDFLRVAKALLDVEVAERTIEDASRLSDTPEIDTWTKQTVGLLLRRLEDRDAWVQADVIREAADSSEGFVSRARVYEIAGYAESRQLKGFTRPVNGVVNDMIVAGEVSPEIESALWAVFAGPGKAEGFEVPSSVVNALGGATEAGLTWVEAARQVMDGSAEWWQVGEIVTAVERAGLRDLTRAKTPEATLRRDLAYRAADLFERNGQRFRLKHAPR